MYQNGLWLICLWLLLCVVFAFVGYIIAIMFDKYHFANKCLMLTYTGGSICLGYMSLLMFANAIFWLVQRGYLTV